MSRPFVLRRQTRLNVLGSNYSSGFCLQSIEGRTHLRVQPTFNGSIRPEWRVRTRADHLKTTYLP